MNAKLGDKQRLIHILEAIEQIDAFLEDTGYDAWQENLMLRLAVVKLLENIGEAAALISEALKDEYPEVEWPVLKGIRNILVHEYFGIDYDVVWQAIENGLPRPNTCSGLSPIRIPGLHASVPQ